MKTLTVRLPDELAAAIEAESRARRIPKSDLVRERLSAGPPRRPHALDAIRDLIGSIDGLPPDLGRRRKAHLKATGYGRKRPR